MPKHLVKARIQRAQHQLLAGDLDLTSLREVMTTKEVAALIDSPASTVTENLWRFRIPHRRLGTRLLFSRAAIVEWLMRGFEDTGSDEAPHA